MQIITLDNEHLDTYLHCLEDWSEEIKEGKEHKLCWYNKYKDKGLRVLLALDNTGTAVGMIQYLPVEESFVQGENLCFILCIWVHGHKEGVGNRQGQGVGTSLLEAAENDAKELGYKGMAAWGLWLPVWMKASWFKKHGYNKADRDSISILVWKSFSHDAQPPKWIHQRKPVTREAGKVTVTAFLNGWCPAQNMVYERAKKASSKFGDLVVFKSIDTSDRENFLEWGIADGIFVDDKLISSGAPLSIDKITKHISKKVKRLNSRRIF